MTSAELTGWQAYLQVDDEVRAQKMAYAISKAFTSGDGKKSSTAKTAQEEEEVIDTTDPEFAKHFKGFSHAKPQQQQRPRQTSTEIKFG